MNKLNFYLFLFLLSIGAFSCAAQEKVVVSPDYEIMTPSDTIALVEDFFHLGQKINPYYYKDSIITVIEADKLNTVKFIRMLSSVTNREDLSKIYCATCDVPNLAFPLIKKLGGENIKINHSLVFSINGCNT